MTKSSNEPLRITRWSFKVACKDEWTVTEKYSSRGDDDAGVNVEDNDCAGVKTDENDQGN